MARKADISKTAKALDAYQALLASQGDRAAFALLYKRWHPKLLRFAYRRSGNADQASDIMQEAALAMAKNIHRLKEPEQFSAWAYTIVRRRAAEHVSAQIKQRKLNQDIMAHRCEPITENISGDKDRDLALRQALSKLPETDRLLLTLFYVDGLTGAELSAALGVPLGTTKSRLFKARARLKQIYQTE